MSGSIYWAIGPKGYGPHQFDRATGELIPTMGPLTHYLVPGFVDIHIHGAFGIDFMSATSEDLVSLCEKLRQVGYEGLLPTTVSASVEDVKQALNNLPVHPMVLGFHLEGPFISPKYPGAQPPSAILDPADAGDSWNVVWDDPRLKVITLAPERPGAKELIQRLNRRGVIVSMGHTDATHQETVAGAGWGVRHATHTYNAMRPLHHREAGALGAVMLLSKIQAELIYDRIHVSRPAAEVLIRAKSDRGVIAVSDSTLASGIPEGTELEMWGLKCTVGDKQIRLTDSGTLAGSAITLLDAYRNLHEDFGPITAARLTSLNPRRALGFNAAPKLWNVFDKKLDLVEQFEL